MTTGDRYDVVVVGGGPSGATAARYLAQNGLKTLLLERDLKNEKPCGGGIFVRAFDEFDIHRDLITKYVDTIEIVSPAQEKVSVDISEFPLGVVHRQEFDAALREMAEEAGATLTEGRLHDIVSNTQSVTIEIHSQDGDLTLDAKYVVAADGVNSSIRKKILGEYPSRILTHYADIDGMETHNCQFWFGSDIAPRHYAWAFPHYKGTNIGVASDDQNMIKSFFEAFVKKVSPKSISLKPKGYFIPYWRRMTLYKDRVFFVGDSASLVLPFTYEGIYYAMKSGRLAANAIIEGKPELYEQEWNRLYLKKFRFLRLLQTIFLRNDWFVLKMTRLYKNPDFQRSVIGYWSGSREPEGFITTLLKVIKGLFFYDKGS